MTTTEIHARVVTEAAEMAHGKVKRQRRVLEVQCPKCNVPPWRYRGKQVLQEYLCGKPFLTHCPWCAASLVVSLRAGRRAS